MVWNKGLAGMTLEAKATQEVAGPLGVALQDRGIKDPDELEAVFAAMTRRSPGCFPCISRSGRQFPAEADSRILGDQSLAGDIRKQRMGRSSRSHILSAELR